MSKALLLKGPIRNTLLAGVATLALTGVVANGFFSSTTTAVAEGRSLSQVLEPNQAIYPSFADMVERVRPAVVSIRVRAQPVSDGYSQMPEGFGDMFPQGHPMERFFREFGDRRGAFPQQRPQRPRIGQGSGFIISGDGYLVTNNHVISGASEVEVIMSDGTTYTGEVVGSDEKTDLALVKIDGDGDGFAYVEFAESDSIRVGDWVVAVGNPYGLGGSVTAGIVSARGREIGAGPYDDFLQIDAPINRGNSGGPTFNMGGEVVGVNTAIFSPSGGSVGIGFAIPASTAADIIEDLKDDGTVVRGWLGVQIQTVTEDIAASLNMSEARGALVAEPQTGGPAAEAGIRSGDVVLSVNDSSVEDTRDLARTIAGIEPGESVDVGIWRNGREMEIRVELGQLPGEQASLSRPVQSNSDASIELAELGLILGRSPDGSGVLIEDIDPSGPAESAGVRPGDRILEVAGEAVNSKRDVQRSIDQAVEDGKGAVLMRLENERGVRYVAVPLEKA